MKPHKTTKLRKDIKSIEVYDSAFIQKEKVEINLKKLLSLKMSSSTWKNKSMTKGKISKYMATNSFMYLNQTSNNLAKNLFSSNIKHFSTFNNKCERKKD